jgi:hypothetical protein
MIAQGNGLQRTDHTFVLERLIASVHIVIEEVPSHD